MVVWWWWWWWIDEVCETRGGGGGKAEERRGRAGRSGAKPPLRSDKQSLRKRQPCLCSLELTSVTSEVTERRHFFSLEKIYQFHEQVSRGAISPLSSSRADVFSLFFPRERSNNNKGFWRGEGGLFFAKLCNVVGRDFESLQFFFDAVRKNVGTMAQEYRDIYVTGGEKIGLEDWKTRSEGGKKGLVSEGARFAREKCSRRK